MGVVFGNDSFGVRMSRFGSAELFSFYLKMMYTSEKETT
jgi:hypothetical protein